MSNVNSERQHKLSVGMYSSELKEWLPIPTGEELTKVNTEIQTLLYQVKRLRAKKAIFKAYLQRYSDDTK